MELESNKVFLLILLRSCTDQTLDKLRTARGKHNHWVCETRTEAEISLMMTCPSQEVIGDNMSDQQRLEVYYQIGLLMVCDLVKVASRVRDLTKVGRQCLPSKFDVKML